MWSHETCVTPGGTDCGCDRRFCLARGWHSRRRADGTVEIRFACAALEFCVTGPRSGAVAWTLARRHGDGRLVVHARGDGRRLLDAARDLAGAIEHHGLAGWMGAQEIAVAIVVAESRAGHALAPPPSAPRKPATVDG